MVANFVPKYLPVSLGDIRALKDFINSSKKIVIVTGAGISTESGIPDYRSEEVGLYARSNHRPIEHQKFLKFPSIRQRYWARNYVGWERFSQCRPNSTHFALKKLEDFKEVTIVTQNVDNLHHKACSINVIEMHGTAFKVMCLVCQKSYDRFSIQELLKRLNPTWHEFSSMIRPDGDVEIAPEKILDFNVPFCEDCGGALKPYIVFFGDNVPRARVETIRDAVSNGDSLLVLGSSLSVYSGYRIILQAVEEGKRLAIVNIGPTRADKHVKLKISTKCGEIIPLCL